MAEQEQEGVLVAMAGVEAGIPHSDPNGFLRRNRPLPAILTRTDMLTDIPPTLMDILMDSLMGFHLCLVTILSMEIFPLSVLDPTSPLISLLFLYVC